MIPVRLAPEHPDWLGLRELILRAFAYMEGRIDPPSSAHRLSVEDMARQAREGEVWAILDAGRPVACVFLTWRIHCLHVGKLAVHPRWQGRGLGRSLMRLAEARAAARGLPMIELQTRIELTENHEAFRRMGFEKHAETAHPGYARPTSVTMRKTLGTRAASARRILFVSGRARARGPTAAQIFAEIPGIATDFAGVLADTDDAVSREQVEWADLIVAMEPRHRNRLADRFGTLLRGRAIVVAGVPDRFGYMSPELIALLTDKAGPYLR